MSRDDGVDDGGDAAEQIRVVIVDDHPSLRDGVRADLEGSGVATVVGEASDGGEAIDVVRRSMPDVVLMDLSMPTVQGVDAIKAIAEELPHVKILVLSASEAEANVLEAIKLGAAGYLLEDVDRRGARRRRHAGLRGRRGVHAVAGRAPPLGVPSDGGRGTR